MDPCKSMRTLAVITILMVVCAGCASASFKKCYSNCYADCAAANKEVTLCISKCIFKCIGKSAIRTDSCNYRCAVDQCPRFGNDVDKVDDCVNKCGKTKCA